MVSQVEQARALFHQLDEIDERIKQVDAAKASALAEKADLERRIEDTFRKGAIPPRGRGRPSMPISGAVQRLMQALSSKGGAASVEDMAQALGTTEGNVRNVLAKAGKLGLTEKKPGKGMYGVVAIKP